MLNPTSTTKPNPSPVLKVIPKVLLQAKNEAMMQASEKGKTLENSPDPWDDGHWANRK